LTSAPPEDHRQEALFLARRAGSPIGGRDVSQHLLDVLTAPGEGGLLAGPARRPAAHVNLRERLEDANRGGRT
jgi:hypothetical protein